MKPEHIPNLLTLLRLLLTVPIVICLLNGAYLYALIIFILSAITDSLDGIVARRYNWKTRLGSILDPLVDKVFTISCFVTLMLMQVLPVWFVLLLILRDSIIVMGAALYHYLYGAYEFEPTITGKLNTFLELVLLLYILFMLSMPMTFPVWIKSFAIVVVTTSAVVSCSDYIIRSLLHKWTKAS